ncbi:hypothetical protein ACVW1A_002811 [Bradyrhizobium sp. LB1.3]
MLARAEAAGDQEGRRHRGEQDRAQHHAIDRARRSENHRGRAHQGIADYAAEAGGQRPGAAMRPAADEACRDHRAENPGAEPQRLAVERTMGQHAPAPDRDGQDQHDRAEPEDLHRKVGADRAGIAENVADRPRRRVAEARILHRPGHHRRRGDARQGDQAETAELAHTPRQPLADRGRQMADQGNDTFDCRHAHGPRLTQSLDQTVQSLRRGLAILHQCEANVACPGIEAVGLEPRQIAAGHHAHACFREEF